MKKIITGAICLITLIAIVVISLIKDNDSSTFELTCENIYRVGFDIPVDTYQIEKISDDLEMSIVYNGKIVYPEVDSGDIISLNGVESIIISEGNLQLQLIANG